MEGEKKRKRGESSRAGDGMKRKRKPEAAPEEAVVVDASPPPTEEEVEEFFAILRRMREAVKYFEKGASNSKGGADGPSVGAAVDAAADGVEVAGKRVVENGGLDLNAMPEAENSVV